MRRRVLACVVGVLAISAGALRAQSTPITAPKRAATNAAAKANARTAAQTEGVDQVAAPTATAQARASAQPAAGQRTPTAQARQRPDTSVPADAAQRVQTSTVVFTREVYQYDAGGRRDPFVSLLSSGDLRPMLSDLKLVGIVYDPTGRRPIAVMRDVTTKDQYRVTVGQQLGRMRVTRIQPKSVIFTIEEFGYSRQEVLALGDSTGARRK